MYKLSGINPNLDGSNQHCERLPLSEPESFKNA